MQNKPLLTLLASTAIAVTAALSVPTAAFTASTSGNKARSSGIARTAPSPPSTAANARQVRANGIYVVRMAGQPAATYNGRIKGFAATRPAAGERFDASRASSYRDFLRSRQDAAIAKVGGRVVYNYDVSFNGVAAELTDAQAEKLASMPGVLSVMKDQLHTVDTSSTPAFLGLYGPNSLWAQSGGARATGNNVVVGIIDSGIVPENPSFANVDNRPRGHGGKHNKFKGGYSYAGGNTLADWTGICEDGEEFSGSAACNGKIIGARYFNEAWGGDEGIDAERPWEYNSPRDYDGHGTHTAATAAGGYKVKATGPAAVFGAVSGMAPGARIAAYKALWAAEDGSTANGYTSDLVAAIDQAVADGVDVINYSVSGSVTNFRDPVEIAFLYAADAGVFVAASAGNSGPTASTVAHPSPWITTVAAGTHNREVSGSANLGGTTYSGASLAAAPVTAPIISSTDAVAEGADPEAARLCYSTGSNGDVPALDPAKVAGKIVVCDRGTNARVDKSYAVLEAGGVGMILVNVNNNTLNNDFHSVPSVHLQVTDYEAVHTYAATGGSATINKATTSYTAPAPYVADFSSRGPSLASSGVLLKPDITAPGQDILAAFSPSVGGLDFNLLSGTSMAAPHIAGIAAALKGLHPRWTPMMIKSAMMTTTTDVLDGPATDASVIFSAGAGHVAPNAADDPGLVFDSGWNDWLGFLCATQLPTSFCTDAGIPLINAADFNVPSIAINSLAGSQTVTRTLKNVGKRSSYSVSVRGLTGLTVSVSPSKFTLNTGATQTVTITFTRTSAPLNTYTGGSIVWSDRAHKVRIPVVVNPVALSAPAQVSGDYSVRFGYDGPFTATARGLIPAAAVSNQTVSDGEAKVYGLGIAAGTTYARFSLFDSDVSPAGTDLDLRIYYLNGDGSTTLVGSSGGATSAEEVNLVDPVAGTYYLVVDGYATANPSTFNAYVWRLGSADAGNMTVTAPGTATLGASGDIGLTFNGLTPGLKYLGSVAYSGADGMPAPTIVRVDP